VDLGEKLTGHARAIIHGWYPGALGGLAAARLIGGLYSPSGKLPVTFYRSVDDLPDFTDYSMAGRTYRYFEGEPMYPFGYGLSYTSFRYENAKILRYTEDLLDISVTVENTGTMEGIEKVQVYGSFTDSRTATPIRQLCGLQAVKLAAGEKKNVQIEVQKYWLKAVLEDGSRVAADGKVILTIGGHQPDDRSAKLCSDNLETLEL